MISILYLLFIILDYLCKLITKFGFPTILFRFKNNSKNVKASICCKVLNICCISHQLLDLGLNVFIK